MAAGANGCDATRSCGSRRTGGGVECAVASGSGLLRLRPLQRLAGLVTRLAFVWVFGFRVALRSLLPRWQAGMGGVRSAKCAVHFV
jgi:hypothetical protein